MNKQYTEEERITLLSEWRESGMSGNRFCRENNIRPTTFYNWTKKERLKQNKVTPGLVKLPSLNMPVTIEKKIILECNGWKIILPSGFNHADAIAAIELVESRHVS